jgi:predicted RNA methylase
MNLPFQSQAFYTALAAMRQFRTAGRLLEACLEDDGESHLEMERPAGQAVELAVSRVADERPGWHESEIYAVTAGGGRTDLVRINSLRTTDDLTIYIHDGALRVQPDPGLDDPARDAIADLVKLVGLVTSLAPADKMRPRLDRNDMQLMLIHAMSSRRLMDAMVALPDPEQRALVMIPIALAVKEHHATCELMCNRGDDDDTLSNRLEALESSMRERLDAAGVGKPRFNRDPRGATLVVPGDGYTGDVYVLRLQDRLVSHSRVKPAPAAKRARGQKGALAPVASQVSPAGPELAERTVSPEVLEVLRASRLEGNHLYLPGTLPRKLYEQVDEIIRIAGGRWKGGKTAAHVLDGTSAHVFARLLATGQILDPKDFDFFATPQGLAHQVVEDAGLEPGMLVAETSAGRGAIAMAMAKIVGVENVQTFELLPDNVKVLRGLGFKVTEGDFLAHHPQPLYDRIVMNPPFGNQNDMRHVEHALRMLKPTGRLVAIVSPSYEFRTSTIAAGFRQLVEAAGEKVRDVESGAFRESGTDVRTVVLRFEADRLPWFVEQGQVEDAAEADADQGELFKSSARMAA